MARVTPKKHMRFPFKELNCPICGKTFFPAAFHVYTQSEKVFCGWNCLREYRRRKEELRTSRKGLKK